MKKKEDKNTRYFLDIQLKEQKILGWGYEQREILSKEKMSESDIHRIFLTKGQYNRFSKKQEEYLKNTLVKAI
jgi:hypothetical protein